MRKSIGPARLGMPALAVVGLLTTSSALGCASSNAVGFGLMGGLAGAAAGAAIGAAAYGSCHARPQCQGIDCPCVFQGLSIAGGALVGFFVGAAAGAVVAAAASEGNTTATAGRMVAAAASQGNTTADPAPPIRDSRSGANEYLPPAKSGIAVIILQDRRVLRGYLVSDLPGSPLLLHGPGCVELVVPREIIRKVWKSERPAGWVSPCGPGIPSSRP